MPFRKTGKIIMTEETTVGETMIVTTTTADRTGSGIDIRTGTDLTLFSQTAVGHITTEAIIDDRGIIPKTIIDLR
jgi:hypothetical protein